MQKPPATLGDLGKISAFGVRAISRAIHSALPKLYRDDLLSVACSSLSKCKTLLAIIAISLTVDTLIRRKIVDKFTCVAQVEKIACPQEGDLLLRDAAKRILQEYASLSELQRYRGASIGPTLRSLIDQASEEYDVNQPVILNAADYGAPQIRKRLFLIGVRKDFIETIDGDSQGREFWGSWFQRLNRRLAPARTAGDALEDMPNVDNFRELRNSDVLDTAQLTKRRGELAAKLRFDELDSGDMSLPRSGWSPYWLDGCKRTVHSESVLRRLETIGEGEPDKTSRRTRLQRNRPSHTLRAGTLQDKGSHTAVRPIHFEYNRVITVREGARLMGYPDWMTFHNTNWHGSRLVGNGVPVKLGYAIAVSLRESLEPLTPLATRTPVPVDPPS